MKKIIYALVFLSFLLTACTGTATPTPTTQPILEAISESNTISAEGKLIPAHAVELAFAQGGIIDEVLVKPGDKVAVGDVLARLEGIEAVKVELAAAELELINAKRALDALNENAPRVTAQAELALANAEKELKDEEYRWRVQQAGNRASPETIREAEAKLKLAEDEVDHWQGIYNSASGDSAKAATLIQLTQAKRNRDSALRSLNWFKGKPSDVDQAILDSKLAVAQAQRDDARRLWEKVKDGPNAEDIATAQARLTLAQVHLAAAKAALEFYELRAPVAGTVLSLDLKTGEATVPGIPVVHLADTSIWMVETKDLAEIDTPRVALDQKAAVKLDAFPGEEFSAKVTAIDPVGKEYLGDMTYKVTVTLDEADPRFMWNMTAVISVITSQ